MMFEYLSYLLLVVLVAVFFSGGDSYLEGI